MWYDLAMRTTPDQFMASLDLPEIYRVGGSVRDELLGRQSKDSDYVVRGAPLWDVAAALSGAGAKIGSLRLRGNGPQIGVRAQVRGLGLLEVVLPRAERSTGDGRHAFEMIINENLPLELDAQRRDFTINAIYRDVRSGSLIDPLGGAKDINEKLIHTTHPGSFEEDPLRMLRALRFISKLPHFRLSPEAYSQMQEHSGAVTGLTQKGVSGTALTELEGILMGASPGYALELAAATGVLQILLPELAPMIDYNQRSRYHEKTTSDHTFDAVQAAANMHSHAPMRVRMALLFHDCGKPTMAWTDEEGLQHYYALAPKRAVELGAGVPSLYSHEYWSAKLADEALHRLNAPHRLMQDVKTLIERHMLALHENIRPFKIRRLRSELGDELLRDLITHRVCDVIGKGGDITEAMEVLSWIAAEQVRAQKAGVPISVKELAIDGTELREMGYEGRAIGEMQRQLLHEVLSQPKLNTNEWLYERAWKLID
jgi:tRNA nucleotidyltransferase (CCA-adding enzyme)